MTKSQVSSQWSNLLKHLGFWCGSFAALSPDGEVMENTSTTVTLEGLNNHQTIRQTIQRFPSDDSGSPAPTVLEYSSLNRSMLLFENGAFSQGSMQFSPSANFGAEFGFISHNRRLRLVPLFNRDSRLDKITLIREFRQNTSQKEFLPLRVESLLGQWQGEAITLYPDWHSSEVYSTKLLFEKQGDRLLQTLSTPEFELTSEAIIQGNKLLFEQEKNNLQVLLLPDGASCNTPRVISKFVIGDL